MCLLPRFLPSKAESDPFRDLLAAASFSSRGDFLPPPSAFTQQLSGAPAPIPPVPTTPHGQSRDERCPQTTRREGFFSTFLRLHAHSHASYFFFLLQRSQKARMCIPKPFPILFLPSAPIQVLRGSTTSFRESLASRNTNAGPSHCLSSLLSLASFLLFFFFSTSSLPEKLLPKCIFHMFPISHALCLTNLLPAPLADAINLLPAGSRARQQNSRQRS